MGVRRKRACLFIFSLVLLLGAIYGGLRSVQAQDSSNWLVNDAPAITKTVDLTANVFPESTNVDCQEETYVPEGKSTSQNTCLFDSPLGPLTTDGRLETGVNKFVQLSGATPYSFFVPTVDPSVAVVSVRSPNIGNYVGFYRHLTKSALHYNFYSNQPPEYTVTSLPDTMLRDPVSGQLISVNIGSIAYSANGNWMVVDLPQRGLLRVNMQDLSIKLFAAPLEPTWYFGLATVPLAISNDGRYVAANTEVFGTGNINMYDLSTCDDQLNAPVTGHHYCNSKDIWYGYSNDGRHLGGVLSEMPDLQYPTHLRFANDDTLSFNARYDIASSRVFDAATFAVTAPGASMHKLGLMGMGDSYISGQGAFAYKEGTDTAINPCHLSELSYPFILGKEYFNSYNSIACSGATTNMIVGTDFAGFKGQVTDEKKEGDRKNISDILANFMPGYIYQQEFASTYQPEAIVLSVGGDDVGFGKIVARCVAHTDTCYSTYEDRVELVNQIDNTYGKLVHTYTTLRQQSGGRLYVVGYPQIAKTDSPCGFNVHLNSSEVAFSQQLVDYLDSVVQKAAQTAGAFYVDTQHAFDGHRLCEAGDKAMNGLTAGNDQGAKILGHQINVIGAESYHPTQLGYRLLAEAIAAETHGLTAPMPTPTPYAVPVLGSDLPILQGVTITGRKINWVTTDDMMTDDFALSGDTQQVTVDGTTVQLQPGSKYQIVLHSDPVLLDEGGVDADGNVAVTVRIPAGTRPGYHVLHLYGTDMAGDAVDVQKVVYVAASADDFDGDGIPNSANLCLIVPPTNQDVDGDGIDDACDPEITAAPAKISAPTHAQASHAAPAAQTATITTDAPVDNPVVLQTANVLGDTVNTAEAPQPTKTVADTMPTQKPYHLDWLRVTEIGVGSVVLFALARRMLRRE